MDTPSHEHLEGFITERDLDEADAIFPGIKQFYRETTTRPHTFLDLLRLFEASSH